MNNEQITALVALKDALGHEPYDPKYAMFPAREEASLRAAVRKVWKQHHANLPEWVREYASKWIRAEEGGQPASASRHRSISGMATAELSLPRGDRDGD